MQTPDLITSPQAAEMLNCSTRTIHRLVTAGKLIPFMVVPVGPHGAFTFERADIEALASLPTRRAS